MHSYRTQPHNALASVELRFNFEKSVFTKDLVASVRKISPIRHIITNDKNGVITSYSIHYTKLYDIDIDKVCQQIGVSHEDYDTFLNEYIDTALGLELDLQSEDWAKRSNAVATLIHLGEVLQLPVIGDILAKIDTAIENEQKEAVETFYAALSRITTGTTSQARITSYNVCYTKLLRVT